MISFIRWLFDTSHFLPRSQCGLGWTDQLRWAYIVANIGIACSHLAISYSLWVLYREKRQEMPRPCIVALFASFVMLGGLTFLSDVVVFWWAPYRFYTLLYALAGVVSVGAAVYLPLVVRYLVRLPSREYVHYLNDQLQAEVLKATLSEEKVRAGMAAVERKLAEANERIKHLEYQRESSNWWHSRREALSEVSEMLQEIQRE